MEVYSTILIIVLYFGIPAGLGFIPANIAKKKGYSFGLFWLYGFLLFIVALIHSMTMQDKYAPRPIYYNQPMPGSNNQPIPNTGNQPMPSYNNSPMQNNNFGQGPYIQSRPPSQVTTYGIKNNNQTIFSIVAAICFTLVFLHSLLFNIYGALKYDWNFINISLAIFWIILIALIVLILMNKANTPLVVTTGVYLFTGLIYILDYFDPLSLIEIAANAMLFIIVLFSSVNSLRNTNKITRLLWFTPASLLMLFHLILWARYGYFSSLSYLDLESALWILSDLFLVAAFLFMGMWLRELAPKSKATPYNKGGYPPNYQRGYPQNNQQGYPPNNQQGYPPDWH